MRTYLDHSKRSDPEIVGDTLTNTLLRAKDALPKAENGKTILLANPYAAKVAEEMAQGRSREFKRIYAVCQSLLLDHDVSLPLVTAALKQAITMLEVEHAGRIVARMNTTPRILWIKHRNETKWQGSLDVWQIRADETPYCVETLTGALAAGEQYLAAYEEWARVCVGLLHEQKHAIPSLRVAQ